jgi:3-methyladenine DNA glycosylase/8-oxoguanine DNA glycosylase
MKKYFIYKTIPLDQINELIKIEPKLTTFLDLSKPFTVRIMPDHYHCFLHSVISQQLASAAVNTIWHKLVFTFPKLTPKVISQATNEQLNFVGLSPQKVTLIKKVSYDIIDKKLNLKKLEKLSSDQIYEILTKYKFLGE